MILHEDRSEPEGHEPNFRSCWECNPAHEHLKKVNTLHYCLFCERQWVFDLFLDEVGSPGRMMEICSERYGLKPGDSTTLVDAGYRMVVIEMSI